MTARTTFTKIFHFPATKILIGIIVIGISMAISRFVANAAIDMTRLDQEIRNVITGIVVAAAALGAYYFLFKYYEKRPVTELSFSGFWKNALIGFATGLLLQSLVILVIYLYGGYHVVATHAISFLLPAFTIGLTSAIAEELIIRGVVFRITEEKLGSVIALAISALLFGVLHYPNPGATIFSSLSIALQAGVLLAAAYMWTRNLWLPIFLHFAWNFAEAGIYGAVISGNVVPKSLITSEISGSVWLTGGAFGPENSIQATIFCIIAAAIFLLLAKRRKHVMKPYWKK
jgi:uncharacterized protein